MFIYIHIALEAFDRLIEEFGCSNPILKDIKEAILPSIFVKYFPPDKEENDSDILQDIDITHKVEKNEKNGINFVAGLEVDDGVIDNDVDMDDTINDNLDKNISTDVRTNKNDKNENLTGKSYVHFLTWRDNIETVRSEEGPLLSKLAYEIKMNKELRFSHANTLADKDILNKKLKSIENNLDLEINKNIDLNNEKNKFALLYNDTLVLLNQKADELSLTNDVKIKKDVDLELEKKTLLEEVEFLKIKHLNEKAKFQLDDVDAMRIGGDKDAEILKLERIIMDLRTIVDMNK
jgi:hypothetical protein